MKALIIALALTTTVSASDFPEYDVDTFCANGVSEQIDDPTEQIQALALCKPMMGLSRSMAGQLWESASPERREYCDGDAAGNYARLHSCLGNGGVIKGDRLQPR